MLYTNARSSTSGDDDDDNDDIVVVVVVVVVVVAASTLYTLSLRYRQTDRDLDIPLLFLTLS